MNENYLNQELCSKAVISIAKAMEYYSDTGAGNYAEVGDKLYEVMMIIENELTPGNKEQFRKWLVKRANEKRKEILGQI